MKKWIDFSSKILIVCLLLAVVPAALFSQSKKELEDKRKKIIRDIAATEKMIKKTKANKEATYDRFLALQSQISSREKLLETIKAELNAAEEGINRNQAVIASLNQDVARMRDEYGRTIRNAFRQKSTSNPLLYILSAEGLNQAFRRWLFLRKYDQRRKEQSMAIRATQEMLAKKTLNLEETRIEKENLLISMQGQEASLKGELLEKDEMLKYLTKDEKRLKSDLEKKQAAHDALNNAIESIISSEVRKKVEEARNKPKPSTPVVEKKETKPPSKTNEPAPVKTETIVPEDKDETLIVADDATIGFAKNRGRLPWPVESGFVSRTFGKQKHPTLKNIEITNNGIDIRTEENASVRAIYEGKVAGIQFIPGHDYTVIIQHGDYYSVYSNLTATTLTKGDLVRSKQGIGTVSTNPITGSSELHFELWHQKERVNPSGWIRK
jgi:septal ring factor EnvC (AmiA/AmiB activator)